MLMSSMVTWTIVLIGLSSFCGSLQGKVITVDKHDKQRSAFEGGDNFEVSGDSEPSSSNDRVIQDKLTSPSIRTTSTGGSNTLTSPANKIIAIKKKSENLSSTGGVSKKRVLGRVGDSTGPGGEDNSQHYMLAILAMISLCCCLLCCAICVQGAVGSESMFQPLYSTTYVVNSDQTLIASISQPVEGDQQNIITLDRTGQWRLLHNAGACSIAPVTDAAPIQQAPNLKQSPSSKESPSLKESPSPKESPTHVLPIKRSPWPWQLATFSPKEDQEEAYSHSVTPVKVLPPPVSTAKTSRPLERAYAESLAKMDKEEIEAFLCGIRHAYEADVKVLPPPMATAKTPLPLEQAKPQSMVATATIKLQFDPPIGQEEVVQKEMAQVVKIPVEKSHSLPPLKQKAHSEPFMLLTSCDLD